MTSVLLTTFGTIGNTVPFMRLAERLSSRGHQVHLWTNSPFVERFARPDLRLHALDTPGTYNSFLSESSLLERPSRLVELFRKHYIPLALNEARSMSDFVTKGKTVLVAADAPGIAARLVAEKFRIPLVSVMTYPSHCTGRYLLERLFATKLARDIASLRNQFGLEGGFDPSAWFGMPTRYVGLWPAWFGIRVPTTARLSQIGFLYYDPDPQIPVNTQRFIEHNRTIVLVSGGSANFGNANVHTLAYESAKRLRLSVIALRPSSTAPSSDSIHVISDAPSVMALMRKCAAVVHHGGMGTIGQAIGAGIPQLAIADGGDRPENGSILSQLELGSCLTKSQQSVREATSAMAQVMEDASMRAACDRARRSIDEEATLSTFVTDIERIADRATIADSCVFANQYRGVGTAPKLAESVSSEISKLSPERRYLLARAISARKV